MPRRLLALASSVAAVLAIALMTVVLLFVQVQDERWRATESAKQATLVSYRERRQAGNARAATKAESEAKEKEKSARSEAEVARGEAIRERDAARQQAAAAASYAWADRDPTLAVHFAESAPANPLAALALTKALNSGSWFYSDRFEGAWDADLSGDGRTIAWNEGGKTLHLHTVTSGAERTFPTDTNYVRFLPTGDLVLWSGWEGNDRKGRLVLLGRDGTIRKSYERDVLIPLVCDSGDILVPSYEEKERTIVQRLDPQTGELVTIPGIALKNFGRQAACLSNGIGIATFASWEDEVEIANAAGVHLTFAKPSRYVVSHIAARGQRVALYLAGGVKGQVDAIAWVDAAAAKPKLQVVELLDSPSFDSGGNVKFISGSKVLAASTDGWSRIVDLDSGEIGEIGKRARAADAIAVAPDGELVVIGRRSGIATVYTAAGLPIGQLLGVIHSDGLNPVFSRIVFSADGQSVLTVARSDVRLWRRPRYQLSVPNPDLRVKFTDVHQATLRMFRAPVDPTEQSLTVCEGTASRRIDDNGGMSLCVEQGKRRDYIPSGLYRDDLSLSLVGPVGTIGYKWAGGDASRLFVLSGGGIRRFMADERRLGRLWNPDAGTAGVWLPPPLAVASSTSLTSRAGALDRHTDIRVQLPH